MIEARARASPGSGRKIAPPLIAAALVAALGLGVGAGAAFHSLLSTRAASPAGARARPALHGQATWAPGARPAPAIRGLRDQTGRLFSLASLRGRTVAMTFFDSHCTQACPLEGRALAAAERALPPAERPVLVAVSVNPLDTPVSVRKAIREWGLAGAPWHWLMGARRLLARAWTDYHIYVGRVTHGDIPHSAALYLIDRAGYERSGYVFPFMPGFVTADLRTLARERRG